MRFTATRDAGCDAAHDALQVRALQVRTGRGHHPGYGEW